MSCFLVPNPNYLKYAMMPRVVLGYNYAAAQSPAVGAPSALTLPRFPQQPTPTLTTGPATTAFHQAATTTPVLTPAVPGRLPGQATLTPHFRPPFQSAQTLRGVNPGGFTRTQPRPPYTKSSFAGKGVKRKYDDIKDGKCNGKAALVSGQNPLYCKVCCVTLNASLQAKQHYEGKSHAKKLKLFSDDKPSDSKEESSSSSSSSDTAPEKAASEKGASQTNQPDNTAAEDNKDKDTKKSVDTTNKTSSSDSKSQNTNKNSEKKTSKSTSSSSSKSPTTKAELNPEIYCKICGVSFNSPKQAQQHYNGKNHAKRIRASNNAASNHIKDLPPGITKQGSKYLCVLCDIIVTSQGQLDNHLKGVRHLQQVQIADKSKLLKGRWGQLKYAALNRLLCGSNFYYRKF